MTTNEKRRRLIMFCNSVSSADCREFRCPITEICLISHEVPRWDTDGDIEKKYAEAIKCGAIKEEQ